MRGALILALVLAACTLPGAPAAADSFTPVTLSGGFGWIVAPHPALTIAVGVRADPGVLDVRTGPLRARVKLAHTECGGDFDHTAGTTLLDRALSPQPDPGEAYQGQATGSAHALRFGHYTMCIYVQDDVRQFATDTSQQVNITRACVAASGRVNHAAALEARALRALHHARGRAGRRRLGRQLARRRAQTVTLLLRAAKVCGF